jgi:hypothetical protein
MSQPRPIRVAIAAYEGVSLLDFPAPRSPSAGVDSPAYDLGFSEDEVRDRWERHFESLWTETRTT